MGFLRLVLVCYAVLSVLSSFCNHLTEEEKAGCCYFNCLPDVLWLFECSVSLPHCAVGGL